MATLLCNIDTRIRNIFLVNGTIRLSHFLNKTTFHLKSDKGIVRELCCALSLVVGNYMAILRPLEQQLAKRNELADEHLIAMGQRLFYIGDSPLTTESLTYRLKAQWKKYIGPTIPGLFDGWGTSNTRQNLIYIGKRCIHPVALANDRDALLDL